MRPECAEQVAKALGVPKLSSQYKNKVTELYSRARNILARNDPDWIKKTDAEKAEAIANKTAADLAQQIAKNNENIARDAIIKAKLEQEIFNHPKLNPIEVLTRKLAYFSDQSGVQSVEIHAKQLHAYWISRAADVFTETQKGFGFLTDKQKTDDIVKALFGTKSADPEINRIADSLASVFEDVRTTFNRNGGNVKKLDDWGMPTSHDQQKVALAGSSKWVDSIIDKVNRNKYVNEDGTLMSDVEIKELLSEAYKTISTGGANKSLAKDTGVSPIGGRAKMANRHQESRVIHFKDGQSWLEYQREYGTYHEAGLHQVVDNHIKRMAGEIAMMQSFGSNPKYVFDELLKKSTDLELVKEGNALKHGKIAAQKKRAESIYEYMDASVQPIDNSFGNIMGGFRALMTASKLGSATLTTISDHANMKRIANMNGISYSRSIMPEFTKQLTSGNHQKEAISMGLGINEMIGSMMRFGDADMVSSATKSGRFNARMKSVASMVMKASGLNATTAAAKRAFSLVHMHKIAEMTRSKQWSELGSDDLKMLKGNGIKEEDWDLWRDLTPSKREDGEMVLTQNDFFSAPDDVIKKHIDTELKDMEDRAKYEIDELNNRNQIDDQRIANRMQKIDDIKRQLSQRLLDYANRKDAQAQAEKQSLQDRIDLIDAQKEAAAIQSDINKYLQTEKQANRIQDFLQQVEDGRHSDKVAKSTRSNVERNARQYGNQGESLGYRLGNAERRITELRAKMRKADSTANKDIAEKYSELDKRVKELDQDFLSYQDKIKETQTRRNKVIARINKEIQPNIDKAVINARYDFAKRYMNHIFSEEGVAIIESGARERSLTQFGQAGTFQGELGRTLFQFKAYPMGYLMRMGGRAFAQDDITSRATFLISLLAYQTIAGGMVAQLQNIANGKQPEPVFTTDFFLKSVLKGGGFSFLGDLMSAMSDPTGRGMGDFIAGPLIGSAFKLGMLFTGLGNNIIEGKESTRGMEIANAIKSNIPFQNLWYTKLVIDRMLYSKMQNMIDPDYLRRTQTRMENLGNQYWWDLDND